MDPSNETDGSERCRNGGRQTSEGVLRLSFSKLLGLVAMSALVGALVVVVTQRIDSRSGDRPSASGWQLSDLETKLMASAANSNDGFAVATGWVDENAEGIFLLDGLSGELQVWLINNRNAKFAGAFTTNVMQDMGLTVKSPKFLLATGEVNFRAAGGGRPGRSVAYVVETTTGRVAAYGVISNPRGAAAGVGKLTLLDAGTARTAAIRE